MTTQAWRGWGRFLLLLAVALVMPRSGRAAESDMRAYLLSINRLYEDLEYERALAQIDRAKPLARTTEENTTLSLYEGVILADMNRWDDSAAAFKEALFLRPDAKLPVKVSPKVEQHFESVREKVLKELNASGVKPVLEPPPPGVTPPGSTGAASTALPVEARPMAPPALARRSLSSPQVLIPAISGGALLVAGGTSWALSRRELSRLRQSDPSLLTRAEAHQSASRGSTYQSLGIGLLGAGLAGLGVAAGFYLLPPSKQLALGISTDGTSAMVHGRLP
jgi:tetratricopeptide (TPR) repeat protein